MEHDVHWLLYNAKGMTQELRSVTTIIGFGSPRRQRLYILAIEPVA
jgi:hypothetical protein